MTNANKYKGMIFILGGLMGGGKTTLAKLLAQKEKHLSFSVSATTRQKREGEVDGENYFFMSEAEFLQKKKDGYFVETTQTLGKLGHFYGTPKHKVEEALESGKDIIFDLDPAGVKKLYEKYPEDTVRIFLIPSSYEELKRRIDDRQSETSNSFKEKMRQNEKYINSWGDYDYIFVNDNVDDTLAKLRRILKAERLKRARQPWLKPFLEEFQSNFDKDSEL